jgi:hypothetical protein
MLPKLPTSSTSKDFAPADPARPGRSSARFSALRVAYFTHQ